MPSSAFSEPLDIRARHRGGRLGQLRRGECLRRQLKKTARSKHTSVGHLVRAAVEAYLPELEALPVPAEAAARPKPRKRRVKKRARR